MALTATVWNSCTAENHSFHPLLARIFHQQPKHNYTWANSFLDFIRFVCCIYLSAALFGVIKNNKD